MKWVPVPDFEKLYEVSDSGKIKSKRSGKEMKGTPNKEGHLFVCLTKNGIRKVLGIHTIVLTAFRGPKPKNMESRHFPDRNPSNNCLKNLSWASHLQNMKDKKYHGTEKLGERRPNSKATNDKVRQIRYLREKGVAYKEIMSIVRLPYTTIHDIASYRTWTHI